MEPTQSDLAGIYVEAAVTDDGASVCKVRCEGSAGTMTGELSPTRMRAVGVEFVGVAEEADLEAHLCAVMQGLDLGEGVADELLLGFRNRPA